MGDTFDIRVDGMGCQGCVTAVEKAIGAIDPKAQVGVDLKTGIVHIEGASLTRTQAAAAIVAAGYDLAA